jgi:hypothetical protein
MTKPLSTTVQAMTRPTDAEIAALLRELAASVTALTSSWGVTANVERKQAADARAMAEQLEPRE